MMGGRAYNRLYGTGTYEKMQSDRTKPGFWGPDKYCTYTTGTIVENRFGEWIFVTETEYKQIADYTIVKNVPTGQGDGLGGRDGLDNTQIGMESFGLANSSKEQLFKLAAKTDGTINNLKYFKGVKVASKVLVVGGIAMTGYQTYNDIQKGNYYSAGTRVAVLGIGFAATAIPVAGWAVAGGIGLADAIWGDQFYNWVDLNLRK